MGFLTARSRTIALVAMSALMLGALHIVSAQERATAAYAAAECSDGVDNDSDGDIDFPQDRNCDGHEDDYEGPVEDGVRVSVSDGKSTVEPGDTLFYNIHLSTNRTTPQQVNVQFFIPDETHAVAASQGGSVHGAVIEWINVVVFPGNGMELSAEARVSLDAENGTKLTAKVEAGNSAATDTTEVAQETIPAGNWVDISVTDGKVFAVPDEILTYRILVTNREKQPRTITVHGQLPAQFIVHEVTGPHRKDDQRIVWEDMEFEPKETREFIISGHVERNAPAFFPLRIRVYSGTEVATDTTTVDGEGKATGALVASISDVQTSAVPGQKLTYRILLENTSSTLITNLELHANIPQYAEFVDADGGGAWLGNGVYWKGLTISPAGTHALQYTVRVRSDAPVGTALKAGVVASGIEAYDMTNVGTVAVGMPQQTEQQSVLSKTADRREVRPGDTLRFTIRLRNTTDQAFEDVIVEDRFDPASMRIVGGGADVRMQGDGILTWNIPVIAPGDEWSVQYSAQVNPALQNGAELRNVVSAQGRGLEQLSLTERVTVSQLGVITGLPRSGASLDVLFLIATGLLGFAPIGMRMRRIA